MQLLEIIFWLLAACVAYTYAGYPLLLGVLTKLRSRPVGRGPGVNSVSVVIAAYNEEASIGRRVREFIGLLGRGGLDAELVVVSDGSADGTVEAATEAADAARAAGGTVPVRVIDQRPNGGKAVALTAGVEAATKEVVVFADARQRWADDAVERLLENFADPAVGAASGDLVIEAAPGVMAGVGLYWKLEKWLRRREADFDSVVGATGAISAVRRRLFPDIPRGTILDDVYWPLRVVMQGFRVIHDERANAFDRLPEHAREEFRRKVRTLSGNYQLLSLLPVAFLPWRNRVWFQFVSHKVLRLLAPWALIATLLLPLFLLDYPVYRVALGAQVLGYAIALGGLTRFGARSRLASAGASFLVLNAAAWMAFWTWARGRTTRSWNKTVYSASAAPASGPAEA